MSGSATFFLSCFGLFVLPADDRDEDPATLFDHDDAAATGRQAAACTGA